jgi:hypothetical protein
MVEELSIIRIVLFMFYIIDMRNQNWIYNASIPILCLVSSMSHILWHGFKPAPVAGFFSPIAIPSLR